MRSSVLLPHPDGPTTVTNSPARTSKVVSRSAWVPSGKTIDTLSKLNAGAAPDVAHRPTVAAPGEAPRFCRRAQCITIPPVTFIAWPVQYEASSEARNSAMLATSDGSASRPSGDFDDHSATISSVRVAAPISVST